MIKKIFEFIKSRTLIEEGNLKKYLSNMSWLMIERAFRVGLGFIVGIYVARYLGPEQFGLLSFSISFITLFSALTTLGLDIILVRELVNYPERKPVLMGIAFRMKTIGALIALTCISLFLLFSSFESLTKLLIFLTSFTFLFQTFNVIDFFFQSKIFSKYVVHAQLIQVVLSTAFKLLLVYLKAPLIWFGFSLVLDSVILGIGLCIVYSKFYDLKNLVKYDSILAKTLFISSLPIFFSEIATSIYMRIDQLIIKSIIGNTAVGYYAAAVIICEAFYFIPLAIIRTFFPVILDNKKVDTELYHKNLLKLYDTMILISIFLAFVISLSANKIVLILFGSEFYEAVGVLRIYIWGSLFIFLGAANERWLLAENFQKYIFYRNLLGGALSLALNFILIPLFNIKGAAISALISFSIVSYFSFIIFKPLRGHFESLTHSLNFIAGIKRILNLKT